MISLIGSENINLDDISILKPNGANSTLVLYDGQNIDVAETPVNVIGAMIAGGATIVGPIAVSGITGPVFVNPQHVERVLPSADGLGSILLFKRSITTITAPAILPAAMLTLLNTGNPAPGAVVLTTTPEPGNAAVFIGNPNYVPNGLTRQLAFTVELTVDNAATPGVQVSDLPGTILADTFHAVADVTVDSGDGTITFTVSRSGAANIRIAGSGAVTGASVYTISVIAQYLYETP